MHAVSYDIAVFLDPRISTWHKSYDVLLGSEATPPLHAALSWQCGRLSTSEPDSTVHNSTATAG